MHHIKTMLLNTKIFCEQLEFMPIFMKIQLEIRNIGTKNTLLKHRKTRFDSKLAF